MSSFERVLLGIPALDTVLDVSNSNCVLYYDLSYLITRMRISSDSIEKAVQKTMQILQGAYSLVMTSPAKLIACRDPYGIRPLCYGITGDGCHVLASETCALDAVGAACFDGRYPVKAPVNADKMRFETQLSGPDPISINI